MRLLRIIGSLEKTDGGPVEAVKQFSIALHGLGHQTEIVTLDDEKSSGLSDIPAIIHYLGPSIGKYRFNFQLIPWLLTNHNRFDAIIVHGIWQYHSFATWIAAKKENFPYFILVHGMLDPWFKLAYPIKHIKKWVYWPWGVYNVLRDAKAVLFTSLEEARLASKSFWLYKANEQIIPYGILRPQGDQVFQKKTFLDKFPQLMGQHIILFMSRINPKKGCDILVEAFSRIADKDPSLHLVVAGPDEANWIPFLKKKAIDLRISDRITWTGMLKDDLKWGAINAASCFVLPSHSENFGIVVVEALACGVPVIITDKVNIWREIQKEGGGIVSSDTANGFTNSLEKWIELNEDEKLNMQINAKKCFFKFFEIESSAQNFINTILAELKK